MQRYHDDGTEVVFCFTPQKGKTFSVESDMYKTFDAGHRYVRYQTPDNARIAEFELTLDVSAYLHSGFSDTGDSPRCELKSAAGAKGAATSKALRPAAGPRPRRR